MVQRSERNNAIIRQLEIDANASARVYETEVQEFQALYRLERMQDVVEAIGDWLEDEGDLDRLDVLGVLVDGESGKPLKFVQGRRTFTIRARDDMSVVVGGKIMHPNRECPVLDQRFYDEVMSQVFEWAQGEVTRGPKRYFG
ncbi:MAG: hypothetical protein RIC14_16180 [Filomicrobium sp.]